MLILSNSSVCYKNKKEIIRLMKDIPDMEGHIQQALNQIISQGFQQN